MQAATLIGGNQMRLIISFVLAYAVTVSAALAADVMPFYPLARQEGPFNNWSGFYVGLNAGWIGSSHNSVTNSATDSGKAGFAHYLSVDAIPGKVAIQHN